MSLSPEAINQSVFMAAAFLAMISVPKLLVLTVWYAIKIRIYRNLDKVIKGKPLQVFNREEGTTPKVMTESAEDPTLRFTITTETLGEFMKSIRDPTIEALTAIIIMFFIYPAFPMISAWLIVAIIVIVVILLGTMAMAVTLWREGSILIKTKQQTKEAEDQPKSKTEATSENGDQHRF